MPTIFAADPHGRIVFVGEVERGLACGCTCLVCAEPVIARQGEIRGHHFAHASGRDPCDVSHESLLHLYAKRVIADAKAFVVPVNAVVAQALGLDNTRIGSARVAVEKVWKEKDVGRIRPDLSIVTSTGVLVAVEIAYSSFCSCAKISTYESLDMPAVEIDLSSLTPEGFDPVQLKMALIETSENKRWLYPTRQQAAPVAEAPTAPVESVKFYPPHVSDPVFIERVGRVRSTYTEEMIVVSGRFVSVKLFESGGLSVKCVSFDVNVVDLIKKIMHANGGWFVRKHRCWNVHAHRALAVRQALRQLADTVEIVVQDRSARVSSHAETDVPVRCGLLADAGDQSSVLRPSPNHSAANDEGFGASGPSKLAELDGANPAGAVPGVY